MAIWLHFLGLVGTGGGQRQTLLEIALRSWAGEIFAVELESVNCTALSK
jgi:hypothetical protein